MISSLAIAAALGFGLSVSAGAQDKSTQTTDMPATQHQQEVLKTHPESIAGQEQGVKGDLPEKQTVEGMPATKHEREVLKNVEGKEKADKGS
jgi:hypothetical protein